MYLYQQILPCKECFHLMPESPFANGVIRYSGTAGTIEAQDNF